MNKNWRAFIYIYIYIFSWNWKRLTTSNRQQMVCGLWSRHQCVWYQHINPRNTLSNPLDLHSQIATLLRNLSITHQIFEVTCVLDKKQWSFNSGAMATSSPFQHPHSLFYMYGCFLLCLIFWTLLHPFN